MASRRKLKLNGELVAVEVGTHCYCSVCSHWGVSYTYFRPSYPPAYALVYIYKYKAALDEIYSRIYEGSCLPTNWCKPCWKSVAPVLCAELALKLADPDDRETNNAKFKVRR